ncbi:hypothetical protein EYF80_011780 [Liparis tanakae]|uniref:Uncharacterized protein n=1 Tax=Liparis tanakae TaxID=230148 RepID=A0A4Z2IJH4_9TELE|nr:hypothetical protein EYF80_011780 [Liparis tanakae]
MIKIASGEKEFQYTTCLLATAAEIKLEKKSTAFQAGSAPSVPIPTAAGAAERLRRCAGDPDGEARNRLSSAERAGPLSRGRGRGTSGQSVDKGVVLGKLCNALVKSLRDQRGAQIDIHFASTFSFYILSRSERARCLRRELTLRDELERRRHRPTAVSMENNWTTEPKALTLLSSAI